MASQINLREISLAIITIFIFFSTVPVQAQDHGAVKDRSEDMFREMNSGELTLRFINALNGEYITGATVLIDSKEYISDYNGRVIFVAPVENGLIPIEFKKEGFITSRFDIELMLGTIYQNRISISPDIQPESIRIVLDWSDKPRDLDAHLIKDGGYHISYHNKKTSEDGNAILDRDDLNGNGPETITVNKVDSGDLYTYKVMDYSNRRKDYSKELSNQSKATVRVFGENRLLSTFRLKDQRVGTEWIVFQIKDGRIQPVDTIK